MVEMGWGSLRVADFGCSKQLEMGTAAGTNEVGTMASVSPVCLFSSVRFCLYHSFFCALMKSLLHQTLHRRAQILCSGSDSPRSESANCVWIQGPLHFFPDSSLWVLSASLGSTVCSLSRLDVWWEVMRIALHDRWTFGVLGAPFWNSLPGKVRMMMRPMWWVYVEIPFFLKCSWFAFSLLCGNLACWLPVLSTPHHVSARVDVCFPPSFWRGNLPADVGLGCVAVSVCSDVSIIIPKVPP